MNHKLEDYQVSFYQLKIHGLIKAVPKLIEKIYFQYKKMVIFCIDQAAVKDLDNILWAYTTKQFLPHATNNDPNPELQPIYLTTEQQNPNKADCLLVLGKSNLNCNDFKKIYYFFDGNDQSQVNFAREQWKLQQKLGLAQLNFWQQNNLGSWENKLTLN